MVSDEDIFEVLNRTYTSKIEIGRGDFVEDNLLDRRNTRGET